MKILLMLYVVQIKAMQFSLDTIVSVTDGVLQKHHAKCLYILQTPSQLDNISESMTTYMALLTELRSVQIVVIPMSSSMRKFYGHKCKENLPFYLLLNNDGDTQKKLRKISSLLFARGRWLLFFTEDMELDDFFRKIFVPYDCEFMVVQRIKDGLVLTEVYRQYLHQILQKHEVATFKNNSFLWTNLSLLQRRKDLQGVTLRVAVSESSEAAVNANCVDVEYDDFCRTVFEIWATIQNTANCVSKYTINSNGSSYQSENGKWDGVIGLLVSNQADVGVDEFAMTAERRRVVNFMSVAFNAKIATFIRDHKTQKPGWNDFLQPFSSGFWWTVLLSVVILTVFLSKTWYISLRSGNSQEKENYCLYNSWLIIQGIFCQQGHDTTPVAWSCRIVYLTAYLTYVVLFAAYAAIYISRLAVQHNSVPFTDFRELIDIGTYHFGVITHSLYLNLFEKATHPIFREIYEKMLKPQKDSLPVSENEGFSRVCEQENYAFFMDASTTTKTACEVMEVPRANIYIPVTLLIKRSSPYHRIFSHQMENLRRTGILKRITLLKIRFRNEDDTLPHLEATLEHTLPIFIILLGGVSVAILCLAVELIYFYTSRYYKNLFTRHKIPFYYRRTHKLKHRKLV